VVTSVALESKGDRLPMPLDRAEIEMVEGRDLHGLGPFDGHGHR
jgi:hypothetical protein